MIKDFKFLKGGKKKIDWELTGLLVDAYDPIYLSSVLDKTYEYIINSDPTFLEPQYSMLLIIMTKLFRDKLTSYRLNFIDYKINEVVEMMRSDEISGYISDLQHNAWTGVDVEAELVQIIYERCNWVEE